MARTSKTLTLQEVIEINRRQIDLFGGLFLPENNLHNRASLEFALETIDAVSLGRVLYPTLSDKAAMLGFSIITAHVFHDGNKRTALAVCRVFLLLNGFDLELETEKIDQEAIDVCIEIATSKLDREDFRKWIVKRMRSINCKR